MAKARVTVTCPDCGEKFEWSVTCYNRREADEWEARHEGEERLCTECWKKARAEERKAARRENWDKAQEATKAAGKTLAPLTGSDKQVEWAEDVRARTLVEVLKLNPTANAVLWDVLNLETKARFWIDCEGLDGYSVMERLWAAHKAEADALAGAAKAETESLETKEETKA